MKEPAKMLRRLSAVALSLGVLCLGSASAFAQSNEFFRDSIKIVGSSTVFPFAAYVAERFYRDGKYPAPVVESTGSGGGIKMFCAGEGVNFPDIVNASRRMKTSELRQCAKNGVKTITEVMIGWDGILIAQKKGASTWNMKLDVLYRALAKQIVKDGALVANPYKRWSDIDPSLPDVDIQVFGPPPTSGTRDVLIERVMNAACQDVELIQTYSGDEQNKICGELREDGLYIDAGEDDDLIVRRLVSNPTAIGILGYNTLERREGLIEAMNVAGHVADFETILEGTYPLSRPLYLYVKDDHKIALPSLEAYVKEFLSERAVGEDGYLLERGLIHLRSENGRVKRPQMVTISLQDVE